MFDALQEMRLMCLNHLLDEIDSIHDLWVALSRGEQWGTIIVHFVKKMKKKN